VHSSASKGTLFAACVLVLLCSLLAACAASMVQKWGGGVWWIRGNAKILVFAWQLAEQCMATCQNNAHKGMRAKSAKAGPNYTLHDGALEVSLPNVLCMHRVRKSVLYFSHYISFFMPYIRYGKIQNRTVWLKGNFDPKCTSTVDRIFLFAGENEENEVQCRRLTKNR
jgi:hypothetical protein